MSVSEVLQLNAFNEIHSCGKKYRKNIFATFVTSNILLSHLTKNYKKYFAEFMKFSCQEKADIMA